MSQDTAPRLPRPTLHTARYVNMSDVCHAAELTPEEIEEVEVILEYHYTWGEAELTLADPGVIRHAVQTALRKVSPMPDTDRRDIVDAVNDAMRGAAYVNLEG